MTTLDDLHIEKITVKISQTRQIRAYEPVTAVIELTASVPDDESAETVALKLGAYAREFVNRQLDEAISMG